METIPPHLPGPGEGPSVPNAPPRHVPMGQGATWWKQGWRLFATAPVVWIAITLALVAMLACASLVPIFGGIAQSLFTPVFVGGLMLGCLALERGETLTVAHLFAGFSAPWFVPLFLVGALSFLVGLVFILAIMIPTASLVGADVVDAWLHGEMPGTLSPDWYGRLGLTYLVLIPLLVIGGTLWAMAVWFAPAEIVGNGRSALHALKASFAAGMSNIGAFFLYGLIFVGLAIAASIPFALGWLVLVPTIATSTFVAWRDILGERPAA
jgi:hypothetical protein